MLHALLRLVGTAFAPPVRLTNVHYRGKRVRLSLEALEARLLLAANAYTVNVTTDTGAGQGLVGDLRYCINQADANSGSTISIQVPKGGTIQLTKELPAISGIVSIVNPSNATVKGNGNAANPYGIFSIQPGADVGIDDLTIEGGFANTGGGIINMGSLTLGGVTVTNNTATGNGGGIENGPNAKLYLSDCTIQFNNAQNGGGVYNSGFIQTCNSFGTKIIANTASQNGGGLYNDAGGQAEFTGGGDTFSGNSANMATGKGGGVYNSGAFSLSEGYISNNDAFAGGGLYNNGGTAFVTLSGVTVNSNTANQGGGLYLAAGSTTTFNKVTVKSNILTGNQPKAKGVGFNLGATMNNPAQLNDMDDPGGNPVLI